MGSHLTILFLLLILMTQTKYRVCGEVKPQVIASSATFQAKIQLTQPQINVLSQISALEALVGPKFGKKKSADEAESEAEEETEELEFPDDFDVYHSNSNRNMSFDSIFSSSFMTDDKISRFINDKKRTVPDLLAFNGYEYKEHEVTTEDGYILTIFQLLPCVNENKTVQNSSNFQSDTRRLITVYLHGFLQSATEWIIGEPGAIYPYDGVQIGREIWLLNFRGNEYGMKHKTLSNKSPAFWRFSFHEQAIYDMPALMDCMLKNTVVTGDKQHTMTILADGLGNTIFYIFLDFHGEKYQDYINTMISLSPIAFTSQSPGVYRYLFSFIDHFRAFPTDGPVFKSTVRDFLHFSVPELCVIQFRGRSLCEPALLFLYGDGNGNLNPAVVRRYFEHFPSTTSKRNLVHYLQLLQMDVFRQFDYGLKLNYLYYNQSAPPPYNLYNVKVRAFSFYGQTDTVLDPRDVEQTLGSFGPSVAPRASIQIGGATNTEFLLDKYLPILVDAIANFVIRQTA